MTIGPVKFSPFGPLAAMATGIKSRYGEEDTGGPVRALGALGNVKDLSTAPGASGNPNQEVSMVLKFIQEHAWKFPSRPPLTLKCGVEAIPENPPELFQGSGGHPGP